MVIRLGFLPQALCFIVAKKFENNLQKSNLKIQINLPFSHWKTIWTFSLSDRLQIYCARSILLFHLVGSSAVQYVLGCGNAENLIVRRIKKSRPTRCVYPERQRHEKDQSPAFFLHSFLVRKIAHRSLMRTILICPNNSAEPPKMTPRLGKCPMANNSPNILTRISPFSVT